MGRMFWRAKMKKQKQLKKQEYKILLVEDGSVDVDDLKMFIDEHNLKIKVVIYRAGSMPPKFLEK
jgi:hypothetical protein